MMDELHELYRELILDHSKSPRNFGALPEANRHAHGHNPLCGDDITITAQIADNKVQNMHFEGQGCAISMASASLMTEMLKGKTEAEAKALFDAFHAMITGKTVENALDTALLDKLVVLAGVTQFPVRVKCATLPWHTMEAALQNKIDEVSTE